MMDDLDAYIQTTFIHFRLGDYTTSMTTEGGFQCEIQLVAEGTTREGLESVVQKLDGLKLSEGDSLTDMALLAMKQELDRQKAAAEAAMKEREQRIAYLHQELSQKTQEIARLKELELQLSSLAGLNLVR
jgi:hypothetical protein